MRANWEEWADGRIAVELAGTPEELRDLADALVELSREPVQHFHICETGRGSTRVGDIEISVLPEPGDNSLAISSFALAADTQIPDPPSRGPATQARMRYRVRTIFAILLVLGAVSAAVTAYLSQYTTIAGNDYRPIWTLAAQAGCLAFVLLQAAALTGRGWKVRLFALMGSLVVADAVLGAVARLAGLPRHL